jgi:hypothetical protein
MAQFLINPCCRSYLGKTICCLPFYIPSYSLTPVQEEMRLVDQYLGDDAAYWVGADLQVALITCFNVTEAQNRRIVLKRRQLSSSQNVSKWRKTSYKKKKCESLNNLVMFNEGYDSLPIFHCPSFLR